MGDVHLGHAVVGQDFLGPGSNVRTGLNTHAFCGDKHPACYGEVHADGEPWMGAAWKVRNRLNITNGNAQGDLIANNIFLGWMNAYNQGEIKSLIESQWLALDDDDGNLNDGTPHFTDIDKGFRSQGFRGVVVACPQPINYCTAAPNSFSPTGAIMSYSGTTQTSNNDLVLQATGVPPNTSAFFFYGHNPAAIPFGNGTRCVGNPFFRLQAFHAAPTGFASFNVNLTTLPSAGHISAGQLWHFQLWYRNPAGGGAGFNLSDGLQIIFCH